MFEAMPDGTYKLEWFVGTKKLEPLRYRVEERIVKRRFWFDKKEYYVVCDFCIIGPYNTRKEAYNHYCMANNV